MGKLKRVYRAVDKAYFKVGEKIISPIVTRKFNGVVYVLVWGKKGMNLTKPEAEKYAASARKRGNKARVVKTRLFKWCVYIA